MSDMIARGMAANIGNTDTLIKSISSIDNIVDTSQFGYPIVQYDRHQVGNTSGFMTDATTIFTTSFDATNNNINITYNGGYPNTNGTTTANEFYISMLDMKNVIAAGLYQFDVTGIPSVEANVTSVTGGNLSVTGELVAS